LSYEDPGPIYDVVLFQNKDGRWKAAIDVSQTGDLTTVPFRPHITLNRTRNSPY